MTGKYYSFIVSGLILVSSFSVSAQVQKKVRMIPVADGWAKTSVNAVIFRRNSLTTFRDTQFIAFYNAEQQVVLGKRKLGDTAWQLLVTPYTGNTADAHRSISIMADGEGYLHLSWDHHNNPLHYCRSINPGSLEMTAEIPMIGIKENRVSYPEFYRLPDGDLLFSYRNGASGNGDLVLNHYSVKTKKWSRLQDNLIEGEGKRNAYCQTAIDSKGTIHLSWVWRETPDVASNHDIGYARSDDGGKTWVKTNGEKYHLPITADNAEYACRIPQNSELINQTSMFADAAGNPYIATYWKPKGAAAPQYQLVYFNGKSWKTSTVSKRKTTFSLSGGGTKKIPVSRPQILAETRGNKTSAYMIFRDEERGNRVSLASCRNLKHPHWRVTDLTAGSYGQWEPSYDTNLWQEKSILDIFVQKVAQGDGETMENMAPQLISVLEWK